MPPNGQFVKGSTDESLRNSNDALSPPLRGQKIIYDAGLLVANAVLVEVKSVQRLLEEHEAQLLNYLKATPYEVGLLLNFGPKPEVKRKVFDNSRKGSLRWLEEQPA